MLPRKGGNPNGLRGNGLVGASGEGTGATDLATFAFAQATPDTELLAIREGILETVITHDAPPADLFRLAS